MTRQVSSPDNAESGTAIDSAHDLGVERIGKTVFLVFFCYLASTSIFSLIFTRLEIFEATNVLLVSLIPVILFANRLRDLPPLHGGRAASSYGAALLVSALAALSVILFPTYELDGGRDHGVYTIIAHQIAATGGVEIHNDVLARARDDFGNLIRFGYPGVYAAAHFGLTDSQTIFVPQFNHLTPAVRAIAVQYFGLDGMWISAALFAVFSAATLTLLASHLVGGLATFLAGSAIVINAAFIYASRSTLTEVYTLGMVAGAFLFGLLMLRDRRIEYALLAGISIGLALFSRADTYVITVFVLAIATVWIVYSERGGDRRPISVLLATVILFFLWSYLDLRTFSWPYYSELSRQTGLHVFIAASAALLGLACLTAICAGPLDKRRNLKAALYSIVRLGAALFVAVIFAIFAVRYAMSFFIDFDVFETIEREQRPVLLAQRIAREFTWYVPLPLMICAFAGAWRLVRQRNAPWFLPMVALTLAAFVVFLFKRSIFDEHPWASRRFLPYCIPFFLIFAAVGLERLFRSHRIAGATASFACGAIYLFATSQVSAGWNLQSMNAQLPGEYERVTTILQGTQSPYFVARSWSVANTITHVYGIPTAGTNRRDAISPRQDGPWLGEISGTDKICTDAILGFKGYDPNLFRLIFGGPTGVTRRCYRSQTFRISDDPTDDGVLSLIHDPNRPLRFTSKATASEVHLQSGWSRPESWGVWSDGDRSRLEFMLSPAPAAGFRIRLLGRAYVPNGVPAQRIRLSANGQEVAFWEITDHALDGGLSVQIPPALLSDDGRLVLKFDYENAISPFELGLSGDKRRLALGITEMRFEKADE